MDPCCVWKWWFHHKHVDLRNKMWEENGIIWKTTWYLGVSENGESPNLVQNRSQLHGFLVLTRWILGFGRQTIAKKQLWKSGWFFLWKWSTDPWRIHGAGIYANIGGILMVNVTIYSIHGSYGKCYKCSIFLYPQFTGFPIKNHRGNGWFPGLLALRNASVMGRGTTCYEIFLRGMEDPRSRNCFVTLGGKFPRLFSQLLSSCASQLVGFASMRTEHYLYVYITVYVYRYIWVN